jgi:hypothetical protein
MARHISLPVQVRQEIGIMLERARQRREPLAMSEAISELRRRFPDQASSDNNLIDAVTSEAVALDVAIDLDVPRPSGSRALERWDNEGGAIKRNPTEAERHESERRVVNDTDGTRRRSEEVKSRNQMF